MGRELAAVAKKHGILFHTDAVHDAMDNMDFDEMNKLAHSLKSSWVPYRIGALVDPVMEIAKQRNMGAANRLATYMAEIDNKTIVKIGPKQDLGNLLPPNVQVATSGQDYAVWERK